MQPFSKNELLFLSQHEIVPTQNNTIKGEDIFDLYINIIQNKREFTKQKIAEKTLQGIMSKFIFSLFASKKMELNIIDFSDVPKSEYGYQYISHWKDFYDVEFGMDDHRFESVETQFL